VQLPQEWNMTEFIWQRPDWTTSFRWNSDQLLPVLGAARRRQGEILGRAAALGFDLGLEARASALVDEAVTTAAIEGDRLERESVRSSVARWLGLPAAGLPATARHVDGLVEMLIDATRSCGESLTAERLCGWNAALFPTGYSGTRRVTTGGWRSGSEPMRVVSGREGHEKVHFEAPPASALPQEMEKFLAWFERGSHPTDGVLRAGLAHFWFVTIHPFDDGNGRIARAIADMALARDEGSMVRPYSMSAQIQAEQDAYYDTLERAQRGDGDLTEWMTWFAGCLERAIERSQDRVDRAVEKARFWQDHSSTSLSERQRKVVNRMLDAGRGGFQGGMTTRKYLALARCSRATAQREIADLVDKRIFVKRPGGGRSTSYELAW
jgi:Fic family protein